MQVLSGANLRRSMAIVVQGEVISAPTIMAAISNKVQITGSFTKEELQQLKQAIAKGKE